MIVEIFTSKSQLIAALFGVKLQDHFSVNMHADCLFFALKEDVIPTEDIKIIMGLFSGPLVANLKLLNPI